MKKITLTIIALLALTACQPILVPSTPVTNFDECVDAGNPVMESYPRQCRHGDQIFTEEIDVTPPTTPGIPDEEIPCTKEYKPVCGEVQVQCIKAPCPPIKTTFSNKCMAKNAQAINITDGTCETEGPDLAGTCENANGKWLPDTNECESISQEDCEAEGGTFNECASACRNDPDAEICTMQCIQVCQF